MEVRDLHTSNNYLRDKRPMMKPIRNLRWRGLALVLGLLAGGCGGESLEPAGTGGTGGDGGSGGDCVPKCAGKQCGADGCGAACGVCPTDTFCNTAFACQTACIPSCSGKVCGPDGCGEDCGQCGPGDACFGGACEACTLSCTDKECGDDGCGGSCGPCGPGEGCFAGECAPCVSDCTAKECGDDGCGNSCGDCPAGDQCAAAGFCFGDCTPDCGTAACGPDGCGNDTGCGACGPGSLCLVGGVCSVCEPWCPAGACGDDGCGGSCGDCPAGKVCERGQCVSETFGDDCSAGPATCSAGEACLAASDTGGNPVASWCTAECADAADCQAIFGCCADVQGTSMCILPEFCTICVPDCFGRECGADGCPGGSCGQCAAGETCTAGGRCLDCVVDCSGKTCGPDGCGGSCGSCAANAYCNSAGQCVCVPNCNGKACGDDGCGGSCGTCPSGESCNTASQCEACSPDCSVMECGLDPICGQSCGECGVGEYCVEGSGSYCVQEGSGETGSACAGDDVCIADPDSDLFCQKDWPGGYCTRWCTSGGCPSGSYCDWDFYVCIATCDPEADPPACRAGYVCSLFYGESGDVYGCVPYQPSP